MSLKYQIGGIGWYNFETLVQTLLKVIIGSGVTSFGGSKDDGRDATFLGAAPFPSKDSQWSGYWVFQVKYIDLERGVDEARSQIKSTCVKEFKAITNKTRTKGKYPENYILITDVPLTANNRDEIEKLIRKNGFKGNFSTIDGREVCEFLDIHPNIRISYPQLIGLIDLDKIFNRNIYIRSQAYVQQWQPRLSVFVWTEAYDQALKILSSQHFVVLDGPPEAGKSTIAAALSLALATRGYEVIDLRGPDNVFDVLDDTKQQVFIADDAVGSISLLPSLAESWARDLPGIIRKLDNKHFLIWTSRSYILEEALSETRLGEAIKDFPGVHEVLVKVGDLTPFQKAEMLYNHAKKATLSDQGKTVLKERAEEIINHQNFSPEKIRQLVQDLETQNLPISWIPINEFLNNPSNKWIKAFEKLNKSEKLLLISLLDFNYRVEIKSLREAYEKRLEQFSDELLDFISSLNRLKHSFIQTYKPYNFNEKYEEVVFQHPSIRDMLILYLENNPTARNRYFLSASPSGISNAIRGISLSKRETNERDHILKPETEDEVKLIIGRLSSFSSVPLLFSEWHSLLSSTTLLIPQAETKSTANISKLDLNSYINTTQGCILKTIVSAFASESTYESNRRYRVSQWTTLLEIFFRLSIYVNPIPRVNYLDKIFRSLNLNDPKTVIPFVALIALSEPLIFRQNFDTGSIEKWENEIEDNFNELIGQGEELENWQKLDQSEDYIDIPIIDYNQWYKEGEDLLQLAEQFSRFSSISFTNQIDDLGYLLSSVQPINEIEPDYDPEYLPQEFDNFWTVGKIFEDL